MGEATSTRSIDRLCAVRGLVPDTWEMPSHGALLGLLLGTRGVVGIESRALRDDAQLWDAYARDELSLDDTVRVGPRVATAGRLLAASLLPERVRAEPCNEAWTFPRVQRWLRAVAKATHVEVAARCSAALESLGASWLGRSGASLCLDDLRAPPTKHATIAEAHARVAEVEAEYANGMITDGERYNKNVDRWSEVTDEVVRDALHAGEGGVFDAMARASREGPTQAHRRTRAMVGLVAKRTGEIVERPVLHSFSEGLDAHEGFLLATSSRAGELEERLRLREIDALFGELCAALDTRTVTSLDCGDDIGETLSEPSDPYVLRAPLRDRVEGRALTRDVVNGDGEVVARRGEVVGRAHRARWVGVREASVRSVLTCRDTEGVCARCYGRDPDDGSEVHVGERVGLRAAWALASVVAKLPAQWSVWVRIGAIVEQRLPYWERFQEGVSELRARLDLGNGGRGASLERLARVDGVVTAVIPRHAIVVTDAVGREHRVLTRRSCVVRGGDAVRVGDVLVDGGENVAQRLAIFGEAVVAEHLVGRLEGHAAWGGLHTPRVHWEVITRAMLAWRRVRRPGDTGMRRNKVYSRKACERIQRETLARGGAPAELVTVICGIGRMAGRRWKLSRLDRMEARADYEREIRRRPSGLAQAPHDRAAAGFKSSPLEDPPLVPGGVRVDALP